MTDNTFYLVSLGCAKNTVDSESMSILLNGAGYKRVNQPREADVIIVNTCDFIQLARQESINVLQKLNQHRKKSQLLIAAGCMSQRHKKLLVEQVPGIDGIISTHLWADIVAFIQRIRSQPLIKQTLHHLPFSPVINWNNHGVRQIAIQGGSAYLKIADGCRRKCAFCAIPLIKGPSVSRPIDDIIKDASYLQEIGIKEMIIIAQDTTDFGSDLGMKNGLTSLLRQMVKETPDIPWIRLLYTFPGYITDNFIEVMASYQQLLHYVDLPLQHAHPDILQRMNRPKNIDFVIRSIEKLREVMPDIAIRTTFIVGYPGETKVEFQALLDFVTEMKFDHIGTFTYSHEKGTPSFQFVDDIPNSVKEERLSQLMALQAKISLNINRSFIGKRLDVLVEGQDRFISVGRSYRDAPEIDGLVIFEGKSKIGEIVPVLIDDAMTHDLMGKLND